MSARELPMPPDDIAAGIVAAIRDRTDVMPTAGLVLGSGLDETIRIAKELGGASEGEEFLYADLPGFPVPSVPGHAGKLWIGELGGKALAIFQGRIHYYEGHGMPLSSLPSQVGAGLGAGTIMLTGAVGAIGALQDGTLVVVRDHVNFMGENPLVGWRMPDGSPAFVDAAHVYDAELARAALAAGRDYFRSRGTSAEGRIPVPLTEGVYAAVPGPSFETPAETEFMRWAGTTVVGMSVVPEALVAHALGMRVLGLAFVTNPAGISTSHEEVLLAAKSAAEAIAHVVVKLLERI